MRKKLTALAFLILFPIVLLFAEETVSMCPYDSSLASYILNATGSEVKKTDKTLSAEEILANDSQLVSYILGQTESTAILVPQVIERDGLYLKKIFIIREGQKEPQLLFSEISQLDKSFSAESVLSLLPSFSDQKVGLIRFESYQSGSIVKIDGKTINLIDSVYFLPQGEHEIVITAYGYSDLKSKVMVSAYKVLTFSALPKQMEFNSLKITSSVPAIVIKDTVEIGKTPFVIDSYSVPSVFRLRAEGFADYTININDKTDSINAQMKPKWMSNGEVYKHAKNSFYYDFARSVLLYGVKVGFQSIEVINPKLSKVGKQTANVLMTVSIGDLVYDLINYSRYAEYISP